MLPNARAHSVRAGLLVTMFVVGFVCGSATHRPADAQHKKLEDAMKHAGESGGLADPAAQLGTSIVDMQQHIDALQKNLSILNKVKSTIAK